MIVHQDIVARHGQQGPGRHRPIRDYELDLGVVVAKHADNPLNDLDHTPGRVEDHDQIRPPIFPGLDRDLHPVFHSGLHRRNDREPVGVKHLFDAFKADAGPFAGTVLRSRRYGNVGQL